MSTHYFRGNEEHLTIGWGFVGTGLMAGLFAEDLRFAEDSAPVAVGSRSKATADLFGDRYGISNRHDSYESLVSDPKVDVVYVATPHPMHSEAVRMAISAGKAVVCEKPFTLNAQELRVLVEAARSAGTFLMEAMWSRFLPHMAHISEFVADGALGDIRIVQADHGLRLDTGPEHRLRSLHLGGGALLDLGIYPVSFASSILGTPQRVAVLSAPDATGVDAQTSVLLEHAGGRHAVLTTTFDATTPNRASISGADARIEIEPIWYAPTAFTLVRPNAGSRRFCFPTQGRGTHYEAAEVVRCLREGLLESDRMPLDESVSVMETMDEIRRQIGLRYPDE